MNGKPCKIYGRAILLALAALFSCRGNTPARVNAGDGGILLVASWNIENFSLRSSGRDGAENDIKRDMIARILAEDLSCPDIIALQEVMDDSGDKDDGVTGADENFAALAGDLQKRSGKPYRFLSLAPEDGRDGGKPGANIRTGFLYNADRVCPSGAAGRWSSPAFASCRKPLAVPFSFRGRTVLIVNVHLSSRLGWNGGTGKRRAQAEYISSRTGALLKDEKKSLILVTGDFNDGPKSETLNALTLGHRGLASLIEGPTYSYRGAPGQLDGMLASPALSCRRVLSGVLSCEGEIPFPSDHRPLMAGFRLDGPEGGAVRNF